MSRKKKRKQQAPAATASIPNGNRSDGVILILLVVANLLVFSSVATHDFVALDDDAYVTGNAWVQSGLTWAGVKWAFTTFANANWHPLTWLSHMLDCDWFGLNAGRHHLTSLVLHVMSSLLLFLALKRMTGQRWPAAMVAALFAIHPLHVESVAWVAERKDVLSGFFCMLTMWLYARYVREPGSRGTYAAVILAFALGLLAKPMLVTLPFLLLLLDYWPLKRLNLDAVREKIPLFVLSAGSAAITYVAQSTGGAVQTLERFPLDVRLGNAVLSYAQYLRKMIWPSELAVYYPLHPVAVPWAAAILLVLLLMTAGAFLLRRDHPWLLTGWLWYGGSLAPVIGILQVGEQAMADRYAYLSLIGIFIAIVWEADRLMSGKDRRMLAVAAAAAVLAALVWVARLQVGFWKDSTTLFERALAVTADNHVIENNLGTVLFKEGKLEEAAVHFSNAIRIKPVYGDAHMNLGMALAAKGDVQAAMEQYAEALRLQPGNAVVLFNRGVTLMQNQKLEEALDSFNQAILKDPGYAAPHTNAGVVLMGLRRPAEALAHFQEAVRLDPRNPEAHNNLGQALAGQGKYREAEEQFAVAVQLQPDYQSALKNLTKIRKYLAGGGK